jgi:hypothetical protein
MVDSDRGVRDARRETQGGEAVLSMLETIPGASRITLGADKGYAMSQRRRKQIEEVFGWMKTIGLLRKVRHRGREKVDWVFAFTAAAYNLVRLRSLAFAP